MSSQKSAVGSKSSSIVRGGNPKSSSSSNRAAKGKAGRSPATKPQIRANPRDAWRQAQSEKTTEAIQNLLQRAEARAKAALEQSEESTEDGEPAAAASPRVIPDEFSRICVKNIPVHLTEKRLMEHFSVKGAVTDAKILLSKTGRSRKMAFIGFKSPAEAKAALQYFNNTYIDTSKISVEPAYAKGHAELPRPWSRYSKVNHFPHLLLELLWFWIRPLFSRHLDYRSNSRQWRDYD